MSVFNFDNFILESYGKNDLVTKLTKYLTDIINEDLGKLILNKNLILKNSLKDFNDINFVNDIIQIKISNQSYGNINYDILTIKNNQIYNLIMNLEIDIKDIDINLKKIKSNFLFKIINHEFLHVIEKYLVISNNRKISKSWEYGKNLKELQDKYSNYIEWQNISYFIYLSLPHEMRSRISSLHSDIENLSNKDFKNVVNFIKNDKYFKDADFLSKINIDVLLIKLKNDSNYNNLLLDFNKTFLLNDKKDLKSCEQEFIKYLKILKKKNEILKKKLIRTSYNYENVFYKNEIVDKNINYDDYL